jgi:hypothetical protein
MQIARQDNQKVFSYHNKEDSHDLDENPNSSLHYQLEKYFPENLDFLMNKLKTCRLFV